MKTHEHQDAGKIGQVDSIALIILMVAGLLILGMGLVAGWLGFSRSEIGFGREQILMSGSGLSLLLVSWYFLRSEGLDANRLWIVVLISILIVGVAIRIVEVNNDTFDYDEYHLMVGVDQSFSEYTGLNRGSFQLHYVTHYWLSHRLLGDSLTAYRTMSLIAGIALLVLVSIWLSQFWPSRQVQTLIVMSVLLLNGDALFLSSKYAMFVYGNTYLVSAGLFFLFVRLLDRRLDDKQWFWLSIFFLPAAYFSNVFLMVPLIIGALLVLVFRGWRSPDLRNFSLLKQWCWELKPLLIFPIMYLFQQAVFPFKNWGAVARADQLHLFFPTSGYSNTFFGAIKFVSDRTMSLFWDLLEPAGIRNSVSAGSLFLISCGLLLMLAVYQVARRRAEYQTTFTVIYLAAMLVLIIIASLLGIYPYGAGRYAPFLTIPSVVLIGYGAGLLFGWVFEKIDFPQTKKTLSIFLAVIILIGGTYLCVSRYKEIILEKESVSQALEWIQSKQSDLILADSYVAKILYTKAPDIHKRINEMGWGTYWGEGIVPSDMVDAITGASQSSPVRSIVIILYPGELGRTDKWRGFSDRHPQWYDLIKDEFVLEAIVESPGVWAALFTRKQSE